MNKETLGIKILQLQANPAYAQRYVGDQISRCLEAAGYDVTTAFLEGDEHDLSKDAENYYFFGVPKYFLKGVLRIFAAILVYRYIKKNKFDIVITHRYKPINILLYIDRLLKLPVIGIVHAMGDYDRKKRQKVTKKHITEKWSFVAVSKQVKEYMVGLNSGFSEKNTYVIPNGVDIESLERRQYGRSESRDLLGVSPDSFVFGAVGRLVPVKNFDTLIRAMGLIVPKYPETKLVIIGDGRDKSKLELMVRELGLEKNTILAGWKEEAFLYVKAFDVFVIPSLSEGTPLVLLEAMSGKVPAIISNIPALADLIELTKSDAFSPQNVGELAALMSKVLEGNADDICKKGEYCYEQIEAEYSIKKFGDSYRSIVEKMLCEVGRGG